jgi:hypothetical protein
MTCGEFNSSRSTGRTFPHHGQDVGYTVYSLAFEASIKKPPSSLPLSYYAKTFSKKFLDWASRAVMLKLRPSLIFLLCIWSVKPSVFN